jgi:S-adenosylmethionine decarboxylase proenzyme
MEQRNDTMMKQLGNHIVIDLYQCKANILSNPSAIKEVMENAAKVMKATILTSLYHHFSPLGVSGVTVIAESHIAIHTWPEYNFAAVDIFYCGELEIEAGIAFLQTAFESENIERREILRGNKL